VGDKCATLSETRIFLQQPLGNLKDKASHAAVVNEGWCDAGLNLQAVEKDLVV